VNGSTFGVMILLGLGAGIFGGMFGIGGGLIIVPFLALVVGLAQKEAIGTSLLALTLPTGLLAALEYYRRGECRVGAALWIGLGLVLGNLIGAVLTGMIPAATMKRLYGVFLLVIGTYYVVSRPSKADLAKPAPPPAQAALDLDQAH
jgi:uncharacterized membrane protein YfcA